MKLFNPNNSKYKKSLVTTIKKLTTKKRKKPTNKKITNKLNKKIPIQLHLENIWRVFKKGKANKLRAWSKQNNLILTHHSYKLTKMLLNSLRKILNNLNNKNMSKNNMKWLRMLSSSRNIFRITNLLTNWTKHLSIAWFPKIMYSYIPSTQSFLIKKTSSNHWMLKVHLTSLIMMVHQLMWTLRNRTKTTRNNLTSMRRWLSRKLSMKDKWTL